MKIKGNDEVTLFLRPSLLFLRDSGFVQQIASAEKQYRAIFVHIASRYYCTKKAQHCFPLS